MQSNISFILTWVALLFLLFFIFGAVHASGIGTSKVTLTPSSINVSAGSSANVGFTITLVSGTTWGTSLLESPSSSYITFSPSTSNGDPTYSGTLTINVAKNTPAGKYVFNISATGDDPSTTSAQLVVFVSNSTVTTSTSPSVMPPVTSTSKTVNYFYDVFAVFLAVVVILLGFSFGVKKKFIKGADYTMLASIILSLIAAVYLLAYDSLLRTSATLHYAILVVFFIVTIILGYLIFRNKKLRRTAELILGILSILFVIAMFLDAALGLPLTSISSSVAGYGVNYLFGFGSPGTYSSYGISFAFSLLLISVTATGILSLFSYFVKKK